MIVLAVVWEAKEEYIDQVADFFRKLEIASREEPGCLMYIVHRHLTDARRFFVYEQYRDEEALDAHRRAPHFQRFAVEELPAIAMRMEGELYRPLDDV